MKVAPDLVDKIDLRNTDVFCADKGYDSETLREYTKQGVVIIFLENEMLSPRTIIWTGTCTRRTT